MLLWCNNASVRVALHKLVWVAPHLMPAFWRHVGAADVAGEFLLRRAVTLITWHSCDP